MTMEEIKQDWFFTFGVGQGYAGRYVKIYGTHTSAREEMYSKHGDKWSMQYPSAEDAGIKQFGYVELK